MNNDPPPGFEDDDGEDTVLVIRHPDTLQPVVVPRDIAAAESRQYKAYLYRQQGWEWEDIARELEYADARAAAYDIKLYVESVRALYNSFSAQQARTLALAELEALRSACWGAAMAGSLPAIGQAHSLITSKIKLLRLDEIPDDEEQGKDVTVVIDGSSTETYQEGLRRQIGKGDG